MILWRYRRAAASTTAALGVLVAVASPPAPALNIGPKLVNIDTDWVAGVGSWAALADLSFLGGDERITYGSLELDGGLSKDFGMVLRGTSAKTGTFAGPVSIRHGGSDLEAMLKYRIPGESGLTVGAGVSIPNTPAQNDAFGTAEAIYRIPAQQVGIYLGAKGAFRKDSTLAAICGGVGAHLGQGFDLVGDLTVPFTGHNTFSTSTGSAERALVYGVGVRFTPTTSRPLWSIDAGITNGLGVTTGLSMSPALGSGAGLYVGVMVRS